MKNGRIHCSAVELNPKETVLIKSETFLDFSNCAHKSVCGSFRELALPISFLPFFFFLQELYSQLKAKEETYNQLLDKGRLMLLSRDDSGSGSKTEQSVALLEQKWHVVSSKMEERKVSPQNTVCDYWA